MYEFYFRADELIIFIGSKFSNGAKGQNMSIPNPRFLGGKISFFEHFRKLLRLQNYPICIGIGVYYPLGMFGGNFELLSASSGAIRNFSQ